MESDASYDIVNCYVNMLSMIGGLLCRRLKANRGILKT